MQKCLRDGVPPAYAASTVLGKVDTAHFRTLKEKNYQVHSLLT